jgi:OOP family OmpA-OmpF porin
VRGTYSAPRPVKLGTVRFVNTSATLTSSAKKALKTYAATIAARGFTTVNVDGFTSFGGGGTSAYYKRLSTARAVAVRTFLLSEFRSRGVSVRVTAVGYGAARPVAPNTTEAGRALNRRAEVSAR